MDVCCSGERKAAGTGEGGAGWRWLGHDKGGAEAAHAQEVKLSDEQVVKANITVLPVQAERSSSRSQCQAPSLGLGPDWPRCRKRCGYRCSDGPNQVSRENGKRRVVVQANVRGRDIASAVNETEAKVHDQVRLPVGYYIAWGGQFENLVLAKERLTIVVPACLVLIFLLLCSALEHFHLKWSRKKGIPKDREH
jgi:hypothetical protein